MYVEDGLDETTAELFGKRLVASGKQFAFATFALHVPNVQIITRKLLEARHVWNDEDDARRLGAQLNDALEGRTTAARMQSARKAIAVLIERISSRYKVDELLHFFVYESKVGGHGVRNRSLNGHTHGLLEIPKSAQGFDEFKRAIEAVWSRSKLKNESNVDIRPVFDAGGLIEYFAKQRGVFLPASAKWQQSQILVQNVTHH